MIMTKLNVICCVWQCETCLSHTYFTVAVCQNWLTFVWCCMPLPTAEFCKKIAEEPSSSTDAAAEKPVVAEPADEDESVFSASTLRAATTASIIMNIRVSFVYNCAVHLSINFFIVAAIVYVMPF